VVPIYREERAVDVAAAHRAVLEQIGTYRIFFYSPDGSASQTAAITAAQQSISDGLLPERGRLSMINDVAPLECLSVGTRHFFNRRDDLAQRQVRLLSNQSQQP
jgi:hypothetical protein